MEIVISVILLLVGAFIGWRVISYYIAYDKGYNDRNPKGRGQVYANLRDRYNNTYVNKRLVNAYDNGFGDKDKLRRDNQKAKELNKFNAKGKGII